LLSVTSALTLVRRQPEFSAVSPTRSLCHDQYQVIAGLLTVYLHVSDDLAWWTNLLMRAIIEAEVFNTTVLVAVCEEA